MRPLMRLLMVCGLAAGLAFVGLEVKVVYDLATHAACAPLGGNCTMR